MQSERPGQLSGDRYQLVRTLGIGGMATVWLAWDRRFDVPRAVKLLNPALVAIPAARQRFVREAQIMARLQHTHLVVVHDYGETAKQAWIVMELLAGGSLEAWVIRNGPLEPRRLCEVSLGLLGALAVAHDDNVVHRDIKPANLLIGRGGVVKLGDFGIARLLQGGQPLTRQGVGMGTESFMAPEQVTDASHVEFQADIFGFGATLFALATARAPVGVYGEEHRQRLALMLAPGIREVFLKATAFSVRDRYATAAEMAYALSLVLEGLPPDRTHQPALDDVCVSMMRPPSLAAEVRSPAVSPTLLPLPSPDSRTQDSLLIDGFGEASARGVEPPIRPPPRWPSGAPNGLHPPVKGRAQHGAALNAELDDDFENSLTETFLAADRRAVTYRKVVLGVSLIGLILAAAVILHTFAGSP